MTPRTANTCVTKFVVNPGAVGKAKLTIVFPVLAGPLESKVVPITLIALLIAAASCAVKAVAKFKFRTFWPAALTVTVCDEELMDGLVTAYENDTAGS